jgi:sulfite reductase (ferredoxin)
MADKQRPKRAKRTESDVEVFKRESRALRGGIEETLTSKETHFGEADHQLLKFHGVYQQDDRDTRKELEQAGGEPDYSFMIRVAIPGGVVTAEQYLALDRLADECGNGGLRITTRQGIQYHCVPKGDLRSLIAGINDTLLTTLAACGDVSRNVMASPAPLADEVHSLVRQMAKDIARDLAPKTKAYHEIWLSGEKITSTEPEVDPFYGPQYLPRKFKVGIALASDNSIDVYAYDAGLIAVVEDGRVIGWQVTAGGGLGMTHGKANTMAALAQPVAFVPADRGVESIRTLATIFRDSGNRLNRKQARLKYVIRDRGMDWLRDEFRARGSFEVEPPRALPRPGYRDYLGQHADDCGTHFYGVFVENGRIKDRDEDDGGTQVRTGLRVAVERLGCGVVFTPNQNLLFTGLSDKQVVELEDILRSHGIRLLSDLSNARRYSMACPALPTCGLALTESERVMPSLVDGFESVLAELGLAEEHLTLRMTGCPNGCARPYTADIGIVGRKPGEQYNIYLGGGLPGDRMGDLYAEDVPFDELVSTVRPLLQAFASTRQPAEPLSDFYLRLTGRERAADQVTGKEEPMRDQISLPVIG